jgi:hypothetical protein
MCDEFDMQHQHQGRLLQQRAMESARTGIDIITSSWRDAALNGVFRVLVQRVGVLP